MKRAGSSMPALRRPDSYLVSKSAKSRVPKVH